MAEHEKKGHLFMAHKRVTKIDGNRVPFIQLTNDPERLLYELAAALKLNIPKKRIKLDEGSITSFSSDREAQQTAANVNITANKIKRKPDNFLFLLSQAEQLMNEIFSQ
ncbi:MAG: hypothetical protein ACOCXQ_03730 [Patescibacteria group bacterium]